MKGGSDRKDERDQKRRTAQFHASLAESEDVVIDVHASLAESIKAETSERVFRHIKGTLAELLRGCKHLLEADAAEFVALQASMTAAEYEEYKANEVLRDSALRNCAATAAEPPWGNPGTPLTSEYRDPVTPLGFVQFWIPT